MTCNCNKAQEFTVNIHTPEGMDATGVAQQAPQRFRKKLVEVDAWPWDGGLNPALERWLGDAFNSWLPSKRQLEILTLEGLITASAGDYIIRGVQGEFYPCKPDIFEATYEAA